MVQVVLSLEKKYDKKLRHLAKKIYGVERGGMSTVVERGIDLVEEEVDISEGRKRLLKLMENARDMGVGTFKRGDAYK